MNSDGEPLRNPHHARGALAPSVEAAMTPQEKERRIAELIGLLQSPDNSERFWALGRLGRIGARARAAVPWLVSLLKDADVHTRKMAALALGDMGSAAVDAVPALRDALQDASDA